MCIKKAPFDQGGGFDANILDTVEKLRPSGGAERI
jgi:hypothetical protein